MPDNATIENLLQQIEESLTHSREIIDQIDRVRQLRLRVRRPHSSSASRFTAGAIEFSPLPNALNGLSDKASPLPANEP